MNIVNMLLPFAIKTIGFFIGMKGTSDEIRRKWYEFLEAMDKHSLDSARISNSYQAQLKQLREQFNKNQNVK